MKKLLISLSAAALLASSASALSIKPDTAQAHFTGFKMAKKIGVPGVIKDAEFSFGTTDGSVQDILKSAKASMDFANEFTKDKTRDGNIHRTFITKLSDSKITASISDASGSDTEGDVSALITFNGVEKEVPMKYELADGVLKVSGSINMKEDFNLQDAYETLSQDKKIAALHGKKTWEEVEISFTIEAE